MQNTHLVMYFLFPINGWDKGRSEQRSYIEKLLTAADPLCCWSFIKSSPVSDTILLSALQVSAGWGAGLHLQGAFLQGT